MTDNIKNRINEIEPELIKFRRDLHMNPELSFEENNTAQYICNVLDELEVRYKPGIAKTGILAEINGGRGEGKTLAVRADFDALKITEENNCDYKSKNHGIMHACGHDGHTAVLLGLCKILNEYKSDFAGTVKFIFQPGEETTGGAKPMIEAGVLENPTVDCCIALHMDPEIDSGKARIKSGSMYASPDDFEITIIGKGGHGAEPHNCVDPVLTASMIIVALQSIVSRNTDPFDTAVVSVCSINAGTSTNVIPSKTILRGTARATNEKMRNFLAEKIENTVKAICEMAGAEYTFEFIKLFPPLINDKKTAESIYGSMKSVLGAKNSIWGGYPTMAGEDFAYFANNVPSAIFKLGCRNAEKGITAPLHNAKFNIDEACLKYGVMIFAEFALTFLS